MKRDTRTGDVSFSRAERHEIYMMAVRALGSGSPQEAQRHLSALLDVLFPFSDTTVVPIKSLEPSPPEGYGPPEPSEYKFLDGLFGGLRSW